MKNCSGADGCSVAQDRPIHCLEWNPTVRNFVPKINHIIPVHFAPQNVYTSRSNCTLPSTPRYLKLSPSFPYELLSTSHRSRVFYMPHPSDLYLFINQSRLYLNIIRPSTLICSTWHWNFQTDISFWACLQAHKYIPHLILTITQWTLSCSHSSSNFTISHRTPSNAHVY